MVVDGCFKTHRLVEENCSNATNKAQKQKLHYYICLRKSKYPEKIASKRPSVFTTNVFLLAVG